MRHEADREHHRVQRSAVATSGEEERKTLNTTMQQQQRQQQEQQQEQQQQQQQEQQQQQSPLLQWSDKQSHILTGGGTLSRWYRAPRFPFSKEELPHFHKARGDTHEAFSAWLRQGTNCAAKIAGAWRRPLFVGGWTHSDDTSLDGETTFNLQTRSLFIDMRIPKEGAALLGHHQSFDTMTDLELRLFARRHAFAGYTRVAPSHLCSGSRDGSDARSKGSPGCPLAPAGSRGGVGVGVCGSDRIGGGEGGGGGDQGDGSSGEGSKDGSGEMGARGLVATRHHAIDWNYVGTARSRPNKWRVEMGPDGNTWREWGFAKDAFDQHVYMERWQRLPEGGGPTFAMRRRAVAFPSSVPDAILVVCGDHFGLIVDRSPELLEKGRPSRGDSGGLVGLVDDAIARGDRKKAIEFLSLEASHGRVRGRGGMLPWTVDCSLHSWLQKRRPLQGMLITIAPDNRSACWSRGHVAPATAKARDKGLTLVATSAVLAAGRDCRRDGPSGGGVGHRERRDNDGWTGLPLEGVWDVLENTSPRTTPHALEDLFRGSGARVARGWSNGGPAGVRGEKEAHARAKL